MAMAKTPNCRCLAWGNSIVWESQFQQPAVLAAKFLGSRSSRSREGASERSTWIAS